MIVLVAGMQKSGSSWLLHLVNDFLVLSGGKDTGVLRDQYGLSFLRQSSYNIDRPFFWKFQKLQEVTEKEGSFTVKSHQGPWSSVKKAVKAGQVQPIYIYRDPCDVVLSAFDHGKKDRARGKLPLRGFSRFLTIPYTINWVSRKLIPRYLDWQNMENCLILRYEELLTTTLPVCRKICTYLNVELTEEQLKIVINRYDRKKLSASELHFNKGIIGRYKLDMDKKYQKKCEEKFRRFIPEFPVIPTGMKDHLS